MALDLQPGAIFASDFRIVRPLSEGGMGSVYVVEQLSTGAQRALKLMKKELVADATLRDRFLQEARVGARIASDHVVQVISAGIDASTNVPWLVMELLVGEEVDQRIKRAGPLSRAEVLEVARQLSHALGAAHAMGVVHRDLKPNNLFLAQARTAGAPFSVKVLDFGIAKILEDANASGTMAIGTPLWMAPEQTEKKGQVAPGTDVWAVGLIVFYLLTGKIYWAAAAGPSTSMQTLLREMLFEPIVAPSQRAAELGVGHLLPQGFDAWFLRVVERDLARRESDVRRALAALEPMLQSGPQTYAAAPVPFSAQPMQPSAMQPSAMQPSAMPSAPPAAHPSGPIPTPAVAAATGSPFALTPQTAPAQPERRSALGVLLGVGALVLLAGGGTGAYLLLGDDKKKPKKKKSSDDDEDDDETKSAHEPTVSDADKQKAARAADCATIAAFEKQIEQTMALLDQDEPTPEQLDGYAVVIQGLGKRARELGLQTTEAKSLAERAARSLDDTASTVHALATGMRTQNRDAVMKAANRVQELQKEYEAIDRDGAALCPAEP
jgi:serine/threonine protein kinase